VALAAAMEQAGPSAIAPITRALGRVAEGSRAQQKFERPAIARVVLLIDQLESLFATSAENQEKFAAVVRQLVATGLFAVVATLRADRYEAYCRVRDLLALKEGGTTLDVPAPGLAEIADIVRNPAKAAGLSYGVDAETGEGLDEALINATAGRDALPLLQFALEKLYEAMVARLTASGVSLAGAKPEDLVLLPRDYAALGGLEGAIGLVADTVYRELDAEAQATLPQLVRALVHSVGNGAISEGALEKDVVKGEPMMRLVRGLLANRILVAGVSALGDGKIEMTIRFAHEAVIRGWRAVRERIAADEHFYRICDEVAAAERRWRDSGERDDRLIASGLPLAEAESLVHDFGEELPKELFVYVKASSAHEAARRDKELAEARQREIEARKLGEVQRKVADAQRQVAKRTQVGLVAALLLAVATSVFGFVAWTEKRTADQKTQEAAARGAEARNNQTAALAALSNATVDVNPTRSAKLALAAWPRGPADQTPKLEVTMAALSGAVPQLREREIFRGHAGPVSSAAFSPDGTRIVTASFDKTGRLWDAATGKQIALLSGHGDWVRSAAFSPDGTRVVTASNDKTARLWDATTGKQIAVLSGHADWVSSAAFSPDGTRIVTASFDRTGRLWDTATGKQIAVLSGHGNVVLSAIFSPDGTRIGTASEDRTARLWDAATGKQIAVLSGHDDWVRSAAFSPDGTRIATASNDKTVRLWNATTGAETDVLRGHEGQVYSAAFSPDGVRVVTASLDKTARLWDAATGKEMAVLRGHDGLISSAAFSSDGTCIVTASRDEAARLWDATTGKEIAVLRGHNGQVLSAAFSPDGTHVVTASQDQTARLWDTATVTEIAVLRGHAAGLTSVAFSPDGAHLITASEDKTARLWDIATGKEIAVLRGHADAVNSAGYSPDGTRVITASDDKTARLWDAATSAPNVILRGHDGQVFSATYSRDGTRIVTASEDKTARLWDASTGKQIAAFGGHDGLVFSAAFSPDGTRIATASEDKTARLWDAATGKQIAVLSGHDGQVFSVTFSPDGTRIATASRDKTARLWDSASGKQIAVLRGHDDSVWRAEFSPDGTRVVTASTDKTARVWDAATGAEIAVLRGHDGQGLGVDLSNSIYSAAFSPDGTRVVTASQDSAARLWDVGKIPKGNIFQVACAWLPDHDLKDLAREYGLAKIQPICEGDPPLPDFSTR
jgi:WD40 repeat protein